MTSQRIPPFQVLVKPAGADCNLACSYCFYLEKSNLYPGGKLRMSDLVLETYIRQLFEAHRGPIVSVAFQGGEPTLAGLDFFRRAVELVDKYKKPGQRVEYSLQTNGILLNRGWADFLRKHAFLVGLSMDGPQKLHNAYRVDRGGNGSFKKVRRAWDLLQRAGVEVNILCTLHAANADQPLQVYRFFRDSLGAHFLQFIPIVEHSREQVSPRSVGAQQFGRFLTAVFDEWITSDVGTVFVQAFDSALGAWCGLPAGLCIFAETCGNALILEHNGDLYSCDHFVSPEHHLGNILETPLGELVASPRQRKFGKDKLSTLPAACRACDVLFACRGECPRNRFLPDPAGGEYKLNYLCEGYKLFFHHIDAPMWHMADLLRQGLPAAEIMHLLKEK